MDLNEQDQLAFQLEAAGRDRALELLNYYRSELVALAKATAIRIAHERGRVTSTAVLQAMKSSEARDAVQNTDRRFMGCVFREPIWVRVGFEPSGSHCRPVSVWALKG